MKLFYYLHPPKHGGPRVLKMLKNCHTVQSFKYVIKTEENLPRFIFRRVHVVLASMTSFPKVGIFFRFCPILLLAKVKMTDVVVLLLDRSHCLTKEIPQEGHQDSQSLEKP